MEPNPQQFSNPVDNIAADPTESFQIMSLMGVGADDLQDPMRFNRFRQVVEYFAGKGDTRFLINKTLAGKGGVDPVDHLFGYVTLRREFDQTKQRLSQLEQEIGFYEK